MAKSKPDPGASREAITADVLERLRADRDPAIAAAGVFDLGRLKKLADVLVPALLGAAKIAGDGQVSPDEAKDLAVIAFDLIKRLLAKS